MKKNNMAAEYILRKVSKVGLLFDFNLQYRSIYEHFKLLAQFFNYSETKLCKELLRKTTKTCQFKVAPSLIQEHLAVANFPS